MENSNKYKLEDFELYKMIERINGYISYLKKVKEKK